MAAASDQESEQELKRIEPGEVEILEPKEPECVAASSAESEERIEEKKIELHVAEEVKEIKTDKEPKAAELETVAAASTESGAKIEEKKTEPPVADEAEEIRSYEKPKAVDAAEPTAQKVNDMQVESPVIEEETKTEDSPITEGTKETVLESGTTNNSEPSTEWKSEDKTGTVSDGEKEESRLESVEEKMEELPNKVEELPAAKVETIVQDNVKISKTSESTPLVEEKPLEQPEVTELTVKAAEVKEIKTDEEPKAAEPETVAAASTESGAKIEEKKTEPPVYDKAEEIRTYEKPKAVDAAEQTAQKVNDKQAESPVIEEETRTEDSPITEGTKETVLESGTTNNSEPSTECKSEDKTGTGSAAEKEKSKSESVEEKIEELPSKVEELPAAAVETNVQDDVKLSKISESTPLVEEKPLEQSEVTETVKAAEVKEIKTDEEPKAAEPDTAAAASTESGAEIEEKKTEPPVADEPEEIRTYEKPKAVDVAEPTAQKVNDKQVESPVIEEETKTEDSLITGGTKETVLESVTTNNSDPSTECKSEDKTGTGSAVEKEESISESAEEKIEELPSKVEELPAAEVETIVQDDLKLSKTSESTPLVEEKPLEQPEVTELTVKAAEVKEIKTDEEPKAVEPETVAAASTESGAKIEEKKTEPPVYDKAEEIRTYEKPKAVDASEPTAQKVNDKQVESPVIEEETKNEDSPITEGTKETVLESGTTNNSEPSTECKSEDKTGTGSAAEKEESRSESVEEKIEELPSKVEELPAAEVETIVQDDLKLSKISESTPLVEEKPLEQPEVTELTVKEPIVVDPVKDVEVETGIDKVEDSKIPIEAEAAKEETIGVEISDQVDSDTPEIRVIVKDVEYSYSGEVLEKIVETRAEKIEPRKNAVETTEKSVVADKSLAKCEGDTEKTAESEAISRDIELAPENEKKEETVAEVDDKTEKEATITQREANVVEKTPVTETKLEEEKKDDEAVNADAQDSECTEDFKETKTSQDVPKQDVPVKKQSNNIIKMVKHSLGKAKKAIIGKSQNTKAPAASETKDELTK